MRRCDDVKMFDRHQLLEEPFAQTLSGKNERQPKQFCIFQGNRVFFIIFSACFLFD